MPPSHRPELIGMMLAFLLLWSCACDSKSQRPGASGSLDEAIKARTDLNAAKARMAKLVDHEVMIGMRKVVAKATEHELRGNILLDKDQYDKAVEAFNEAAKLYTRVADATYFLERIAKAREFVARAKALVDSSTPSERVDEAKRLEVDADGYFEAGDAEQCLAKLEAASKAYEVLTIENLEAAVAKKERFAAESWLARLMELIPGDARLAGWREKVDALPWPKSVTVDLGKGVKMDLVMVPAGSFTMGSSDGLDDEKPAHKVTISKPFYLGKYEVTQAQWQAVMGSTPSQFKGAGLPVESVSWNDCQEFLEKLQAKSPVLKFSLPTEAQWEYACRAGGRGKFTFGDKEDGLGDYAWYDKNADRKTHDAGGKKPNKWGLYDMHGNVWEWCADWHGAYATGAQKDPTGPSSGVGRVLRGGSWITRQAHCRSAVRDRLRLDNRYNYNGFRVAAGTP